MVDIVIVDIKPRLSDRAVRDLLALSLGFPTFAKVAAVCKQCQSNSNWKILGSERNGRLVGCIGLEIRSPNEAVIQHIAVAPAERRAGVGRMLIKESCHRLSLNRLVAETDSDATEFYRRCGFSVQSLGEKYPGTERFLCSLGLGE